MATHLTLQANRAIATLRELQRSSGRITTLLLAKKSSNLAARMPRLPGLSHFSFLEHQTNVSISKKYLLNEGVYY